MRFFPRDTQRKWQFGSESLENGHFPCVLPGKNRMLQGVENQGSLISVPLALRVVFSLRGFRYFLRAFPSFPRILGFGRDQNILVVLARLLFPKNKERMDSDKHTSQ